VSEPLHETTPGRPATAIPIPVVLCGAPGVRTKILSTKKGPDASIDRGLTESSGEVFSLDILSHRKSDIAMFPQQPIRVDALLGVAIVCRYSQDTEAGRV